MWNIEKIVSKGVYNYAKVLNHPSASKHGYVLEHRIVMENYLGRLLDESEIVHHLDGERKNNVIENLELCDKVEHNRTHTISRGKMWVILKCPNCGKIFEIAKNQSFLQKGYSYTCCSKRCRGKLSRYIQLNGLTHEVDRAISGNLVLEFIKIS